MYETKGFLNIAKIDFIEYIQKLELLGVKNIQFNPSMFPTTSSKYIESVENGINNTKCTNKYYTDGKFKLYKPRVTFYRDNFRYNMVEIKDASFLIYTKISHEVPYKEKEPIVLESDVVVKNFNGKLPNKEDVINCNYPSLNIHSRKINWGESPEYSQTYKEFTHEEYEKKKIKLRSLTIK